MLCEDSKKAHYAMKDLLEKDSPQTGYKYKDLLSVRIIPFVLPYHVHSYKLA